MVASAFYTFAQYKHTKKKSAHFKLKAQRETLRERFREKILLCLGEFNNLSRHQQMINIIFFHTIANFFFRFFDTQTHPLAVGGIIDVVMFYSWRSFKNFVFGQI